jgi:hypothetical protein
VPFYAKAVSALVRTGLLDKGDADTAEAVLVASSVNPTNPAWAVVLAQAGLLDRTNVEAGAAMMERAGDAAAKQDPKGFEESLADAGIL